METRGLYLFLTGHEAWFGGVTATWLELTSQKRDCFSSMSSPLLLLESSSRCRLRGIVNFFSNTKKGHGNGHERVPGRHQPLRFRRSTECCVTQLLMIDGWSQLAIRPDLRGEAAMQLIEWHPVVATRCRAFVRQRPHHFQTLYDSSKSHNPLGLSLLQWQALTSL
ncbi:hypothetical protein VTI74DRAFT_5324 [Chaetomium olivicolor]